MSEWYTVEARSATRDLWVTVFWEGKPEYGRPTLPDGRDIYGLIDDGLLDQLPFPVWFAPWNSGKRRRDLLWTGDTMKIASRRFVDTLESIGASGYRAFEIDLRERSGKPIPDYVGFAVTSASDDTDVRHLYGHQNFSFRIKPHVLDALRTAGTDDVLIEPFTDE